MKIVNLSWDDYANFAYDNMKAMRAAGVTCEAYKINPHAFNYPQECEIITYEQIKEKCKDADVIQLFHSPDMLYGYVKELGKQIVVWHTGTNYRIKHKYYNRLFSNCINIIALGEFHQFNPSAYYVVGAMEQPEDIRYIPKIRHHPSNPAVKGTALVDKFVKESKIKYEWICDTTKLPYTESLERLKDCSIYIEMFALMNSGQPYGSWGITTLEAASMGKIVLTNHTTLSYYQSVYGDSALLVADSEKDFKNHLIRLNEMSEDQVLELQRKTREWSEKHNYKNTGDRIKWIIEQN